MYRYTHAMHIYNTCTCIRHQCYVHMTCNTPTPGHPSAADDAGIGRNASCALGDFHFLHLGLCVIYMYGCSQPRELWFIDFNHVHIMLNSLRCMYCIGLVEKVRETSSVYMYMYIITYYHCTTCIYSSLSCDIACIHT